MIGRAGPLALVVISVTWSLGGCLPKQPGGRGGPRAVQRGRDSEAQADLPGPRAGEAELARFLDRHPDHPAAPRAALDLAKVKLQQGDPESAKALLTPLADGAAEPRGQILLTLALAEHRTGDFRACATHASVAGMSLSGREALEGLLLQGECHFQDHAAGPALRAFGQAYEQVRDEPGLEGYVTARVRDLTATQLGHAEAATLLAAVDELPMPRAYLALRLYHDALDRGERDAAARYLSLAGNWFEARGKALPAAGFSPESAKVVALLPLSGPSRRVGSRLLDVLLLASGSRCGPAPTGPPCDVAVGGPRLVVRDTRSDPEVVGELIRDLVTDPDTVGVVGPVQRDVVEAAVEALGASDLPLMPITLELPDHEGASVFRVMGSNEREVAAIAQHAIDVLGVERFAILAPDIPYGVALADLFERDVRALGGRIVAREAYDPKGFDPRALVGRLGHMGPFQALFIPDSHRRVALLVSHMASAGWWSVRFGDRPPRSKTRRLRPVQLLGTSAWYDPRLLRSAGPNLEGALIPTWCFLQDPDLAWFGDAVTSGAGRSPTCLDGFAWDAFRLLAGHLPEAKDRAGLVQALRTAGVSGTVTALDHFDPSGEPVGGPILLGVHDERFELVRK